MQGWIKLSRQIADADFYFGEKFDRTRCLIDLMLLAEWKENRSIYIRGTEVQLVRNQIAMSIRDLAKRWKMTVNSTQKRLNEFERKGIITIQRSKLINIITICDSDFCKNTEEECNRDGSSTQ